MNRISKGLFFFLWMCTLSPFAAVATQEENLCTQILNKATKTYEAGKLNEIPSMLESCLQNGFTQEEKIQAYRLLALTYLFLDEDEKAESSLLSLLKEDPEYKVNEALEPAEFIQLYKKYRTLPIISVGAVGGLNQTMIREINAFSTDNTNSSKLDYSPKVSFQVGLTADFLIYRNLQLNASVLFSGKKYEANGVSMFGYTNLNLVEQQNWLELPLTLKYTVGKGKLKGFAEAGIGGGLFLSSSANVSRISVSGDNDASGPSVKMTSLRNRLNYYGIGGIGARYKIGYGYAILNIRYQLGMKNVIKSESRYSHNELIYYYGYIDSDYALNGLSVSVGYLKSIYKPKKVKVKND